MKKTDRWLKQLAYSVSGSLAAAAGRDRDLVERLLKPSQGTELVARLNALPALPLLVQSDQMLTVLDKIPALLTAGHNRTTCWDSRESTGIIRAKVALQVITLFETIDAAAPILSYLMTVANSKDVSAKRALSAGLKQLPWVQWAKTTDSRTRILQETYKFAEVLGGIDQKGEATSLPAYVAVACNSARLWDKAVLSRTDQVPNSVREALSVENASAFDGDARLMVFESHPDSDASEEDCWQLIKKLFAAELVVHRNPKFCRHQHIVTLCLLLQESIRRQRSPLTCDRLMDQILSLVSNEPRFTKDELGQTSTFVVAASLYLRYQHERNPSATLCVRKVLLPVVEENLSTMEGLALAFSPELWPDDWKRMKALLNRAYVQIPETSQTRPIAWFTTRLLLPTKDKDKWSVEQQAFVRTLVDGLLPLAGSQDVGSACTAVRIAMLLYCNTTMAQGFDAQRTRAFHVLEGAANDPRILLRIEAAKYLRLAKTNNRLEELPPTLVALNTDSYQLVWLAAGGTKHQSV